MRTLILSLCAGMLCGSSAVYLATSVSAPRSDKVTCRPSNPTDYIAHHRTPAVLLFGNSLLFDHDWQLTQATAINCARQGLTAQAAQDLVDHLPVLTPQAIIMGFGSVELQRANHSTPDFQTTITTLLSTIRQRWPTQRIVLLSVPEAGPHTTNAVAFNHVLRDLVDTQPDLELLDLDALPLPKQDMLYDGVHLTRPVYRVLQTALDQSLAR